MAFPAWQKLIRTLGACAAVWIAAGQPPLAAMAATQTQTLRVGLSSLPTGNGNPFSNVSRTAWYTYRALFDTLTQLGPGTAPEPALAVDWHSTDPLTWVVKLRPHVIFSNGERFDADAVIASYAYLQSPDGAREALARETDNIAGMRALDPLTVEFTTRTPDPYFPRQMTVIPIVAPAHWKTVGPAGFNFAPVGTGPFAVETWGDARVMLKAFRESWRAPKVDALEILAMPDIAGRVQGLLSGRVDIASEIGTEGIATVTAAGFASYQRPSTSVQVIAFNALKPGSPFKDARVRQAMNYAVNREAITTVLLQGLAPPASQMVARSNPEYDPALAPYPYDPEKAKALLAEAGFGGGFRFVMEMSSGTSGTDDPAVAQQVAQDLARIGVRMDIRPIPWSQFVRGINQGGWNGDSFYFEYETLPTGDALRSFRLHSCTWMHPWYCDETMTPLIAEAKTTFDPARRRELVTRILTTYRDQAAALILFEPLGLDGLSPNVTGYDQTNGIIPYHQISLSGAANADARP